MKITKIAIMLGLGILLLCNGCGSSKVTQENYQKIETGMTKEQVIEILGQPDQIVEQSPIDGMKVDMYTWNDISTMGCKSISVFLTNGKVDNKIWSDI